MYYLPAANVIVFVHLVFILFVSFGGLLLLRNWKWAWIHLPAVLWGAIVEFTGWICPLTPLENWLREKGGYEVYREAFIDHYIMPVIYPSGYSGGFQIFLGVSVIVINVVVYVLAFNKHKH